MTLSEHPHHNAVPITSIVPLGFFFDRILKYLCMCGRAIEMLFTITTTAKFILYIFYVLNFSIKISMLLQL